MYDLVLPKNNEEELLKQAELLGNKVILLYRDLNKDKIAALRKKFPKQKLGLWVNVEKASDLKKLTKVFRLVDVTIGSGNGSEISNNLLSGSLYVDFIANISNSEGRDHTHYRRSGLNQVIAKESVRNRQAYCIDFNKILELESHKRIMLLGRIMQNIRIFNKYKVPVVMGSLTTYVEEMRSISDLSAFLRVLGGDYSKTAWETVFRKRREVKAGVEIIV